MVFFDRSGSVLAAKDLCCSAASMKHSPYYSKHVVFIYDVCLKNIAQAASQRCKSHLVLYAICTDCTSKCQRVFAAVQCLCNYVSFYFLHLPVLS